MNIVTIEIWLWLGIKLDREFYSKSKMKSIGKFEVEDGSTVRKLLRDLASRYGVINEQIFRTDNDRLNPEVTLVYNDRVINPRRILDQILNDNDKVTVLPGYFGG